jgi:hypothetical protein
MPEIMNATNPVSSRTKALSTTGLLEAILLEWT